MYNAYPSSRLASAAPSEGSSSTGEKAPPVTTSSTIPPYNLWDTKDPDLDDALHNPDPIRDAALDRSFTILSTRGWLNVSALIILVAGLITLFAGYPIIAAFNRKELVSFGANFGGANGTGQIPQLSGVRSLIDNDTDTAFYTRTGTDGHTYNLVFSDEFNTEGRTFWPGDDAYWTAVDLHYWWGFLDCHLTPCLTWLAFSRGQGDC